jgi:DNA-binding winged helix-turn-helix (wHTH) protein
MALAENLTHHPRNFDQAPSWIQTRLVWFIKKSVQGDLAVRLGPLLDEVDSEGVALLKHIQNYVVEDVLRNPAPEQLIGEVLKGLKRLGIEGFWVISDGLEGWAQTDSDLLTENLTVFLSALSLFERSGLVFKLCLPAHLRLSVVLQRNEFTLEDLCNAPGWVEWLERVGGISPREWLDQVRPLIGYYLEHQLSKPIGEKSWKRLRLEDPPRFWMDDTGRKVTVGGREIPLSDLPPKTYDMLRYLYRHSGEVVSKNELYFLVYRGLENIPRAATEEAYESPKDYAGLIDTSIYRIRQAIEPDPANPVLLRTVRGHGICLVSRW